MKTPFGHRTEPHSLATESADFSPNGTAAPQAEGPTTGVFTQVKRRQNFDVTPGTDWTIFLTLSIGRHVQFDAC